FRSLVGKYGGSMSGEHGDGRARSELLPAMYSADAIEVMAAVKAIFDPGNVLNPGVLVDPAPLDADLRVPLARPLSRAPRRGVGFAYSHDGGDLSAAVHRCVGVGKCRADTTGSGGVMCPSWLATRDEEDSTRGRARVLAGLAKRLGGIDARRPLPRFAAQTFRAWFAARPGPGSGTPVLLWVDTFTDYFTPEVGRAAVRVLEAAGYGVQVTAEPVCCRLTWISTRQLDGARMQRRRSLPALRP